MSDSAKYGDGLRADLYDFVHAVVETERGVSLRQNTLTSWFARPDIFAGYLAIKPIALAYPIEDEENFRVQGFEMILDGGDTSLYVSPELMDTMDGDSFAEYVLDEAKSIYVAHDHEDCLAAAVAKQQAVPPGVLLARRRALHGGEVLVN